MCYAFRHAFSLGCCFISHVSLAWNCAREVLQTYPEYYELQKLNSQLVKQSIQKIFAEKLVIEDVTPVMSGEHATGFKRAFLPRAFTGFFLPEDADLKKTESIKGYDGYIIILPRIATNHSNATTLFTIGQTLRSGKDTALEIEGRNKKLKLLPILLDATLGGMASKAPFYFAEHWAAIEVVHHMRLILKLAFPDSKFFLAARSQGGIIAMEYAEWFGDVDKVVAVNPSPIHQDLHQKALELGAKNIKKVMNKETHLNHTFDSYTHHTPSFIGFGENSFFNRVHRWLIRRLYQKPKFEIPTQLLVGELDVGYPPEYLEYVKQFVAKDNSREAVFFPRGTRSLESSG